MKGTYKIGFEMNRMDYFCYEAGHGTIFGAFECSFSKRSIFLIKATSYMEGFSIFKRDWRNISMDFPELMDQVKRKTTAQYIKVKAGVKIRKQVMLERFMERADFAQVMVCIDNVGQQEDNKEEIAMLFGQEDNKSKS